jgi:cellulose 1,4-beta-cellobiosidase
MNIDTVTGAFSVTQGPTCGAYTVGSYPDILYGTAFGTSTAAPCALPAQVSSLACVTSDWNFAVSQTGVWDVAYDIWFCPDNTCGPGGFNGGAEMMIWVDYTSNGWQTDLGPVSVSGMPWELWLWNQGSGGVSWTYLAYLSKAPSTSVTNLDIKGFIGDAVSRGYIQPSWYLYAVEAGIEIQNGAIPFSSNSFSVSVNACLSSPTATPTPTTTTTPTSTATPGSPTPTPTATATVVSTNLGIGLPYPNPVRGPGIVNVDIQGPSGTTVTWDVFTMAYRKIACGTQAVSGKATLSWDRLDGWGRQAANGLYYLRVKVTGGGNSITKILKVIILG